MTLIGEPRTDMGLLEMFWDPCYTIAEIGIAQQLIESKIGSMEPCRYTHHEEGWLPTIIARTDYYLHPLKTLSLFFRVWRYGIIETVEAEMIKKGWIYQRGKQPLQCPSILLEIQALCNSKGIWTKRPCDPECPKNRECTPL